MNTTLEQTIELNKTIINDIKFFTNIAKKKGYKSRWIIVKTYEKYNNLVLKKKILSALADTIHLSKAEILSYTKVLKNKGIKNKYIDEVDRIEGKVKQVMTDYNKAAFLLEQHNKHKTGYINE